MSASKENKWKKMFSTSVVKAIVILLCVKACICRPTCPKGQYFDGVVGRCSPCSDICEHVKIQRTEVECDRKCPGYKSAGISPKPSSIEAKTTISIGVAILLGATVIALAVTSIVVIWKREKVKHFICRLMGRQGEDNDETLAMRVAFGADPPPADGDTADRINEELSSMVPSSDNNIAQATDRGPAYLPTTGVTNVIGNGL